MNTCTNCGDKKEEKMEKILSLGRIKNMSIDDMVELYRNGYVLEDVAGKFEEEKLPYRGYVIPPRFGFMSLGPHVCPSSIQKGTTKSINMSVTGGTPPFIYRLYADDVLKLSAGPKPETSHTFDYTFDEIVGSHIYKGELVDSCPTGPQTDTSSCTLDITEKVEGVGILPILLLGLVGMYIVTRK